MSRLLERLFGRPLHRIYVAGVPAEAATCQPWHVPSLDRTYTYAGVVFPPPLPRELGRRTPIGREGKFTGSLTRGDEFVVMFYSARGGVVAQSSVDLEPSKRDHYVVYRTEDA